MAEENVTVENEANFEAQRKTLFIRNLPYSTTTQQLEDAFSEYGPIKRCFVVKDKDSSRSCRGFGYVTFVIPEDAIKAQNAGITISGRTVLVSIADKKPRQRDNYKQKSKESSGDAADAAKVIETNHDENLVEKAAKKIAHQKTGDSTEEIHRTIVISGLPNTATKSKLKQLCCKFGKVKKIQFPAPDRDESTSIVIFKSIKGAVRSFQKLNGTKFDENFINACLIAKEGKKPIKRELDKAKLIVRNIAFKCKEENLKNAFKKFGEIISIELPSKIDGKGRKRMRGFAFIQFTNKDQANSAMENMNKTMMHGRPIIIDWAVPKDEFVAQNEDLNMPESKREIEGKKPEKTVRKQKDDDEDDDELDGTDEDEDDDEDGHDDDDGDDDVVVDDDDGSGDEQLSDENESAEERSDDDHEIEIPKKAKKQSHDVKEGRTVFIRNLPFEAAEEELNELFAKYGEIDDCKVVVDHETGHSRGSAFVKFKDAAVVEKVISDSENPDVRTGGITMDGRRLVVMKAVTRGKVKEIEKQAKDAKKEQKDKRNLSLAQEGVIFPNSEAAKEISEADMKKREKAWAEKKTKLKNQNYFVSRTRLSFRNLPLSTGEVDLRKAIMKAVNRKQTKINKIRIMRSKERLDKSGKGRSLGYGFVEFETHEDALATLRATNNSPDIFGDARRPIVEFSVENKVALDLQEKRRERQLRRTGKTGEASKGQEKRGKENIVDGGAKEKGVKKELGGKQRERGKTRKRKGAIKGDEEDATKGNDTQGLTKKFRKEKGFQKGSQDRSFNNKPKTFVAKKGQSGKGGERKRKAVLGEEMQAKPAKVQKMKKRVRTDKEEEKFNILVNKYKEKLFGDGGDKKKNEKRWYE